VPRDEALDGVIREVLADHGRLVTDVRSCGVGDDLYVLGLSSHACVNVMLALEERFDVEFPDHLLKAETFASISAIRGGLRESGVVGEHTTVPGAGT